jgi:hypothetical protein
MAGPVKEFEVHPYVQFMMDKYSPYKKWIESAGVPIIGGAFVQDVRTQKLEHNFGVRSLLLLFASLSTMY